MPIAPVKNAGVTSRTVVLAPGCKTGKLATKRWPYFTELAAAFDDLVVVGTPADLRRNGGPAIKFSRHVRSLVGTLTLRETAEAMVAAGVVVGNDSGLSHIAAAVGTPTIMLFGPTPRASGMQVLVGRSQRTFKPRETLCLSMSPKLFFGPVEITC